MGIIVLNLAFVVIGLMYFVAHLVKYIIRLRRVLDKKSMKLSEYLYTELKSYALEKEIIKLRLNEAKGKVMP